MHRWPEIRDAAAVASVFHMDPVAVLDADPVTWRIRLACLQALDEHTKKSQRTMNKAGGERG